MQPCILPSCRRSPAVTTAPAGRLLNAPAQVGQQGDPEDQAGEPVAVCYPARLPTESPAWAKDGAIRSAGASRRRCGDAPAGGGLRRRQEERGGGEEGGRWGGSGGEGDQLK